MYLRNSISAKMVTMQTALVSLVVLLAGVVSYVGVKANLLASEGEKLQSNAVAVASTVGNDLSILGDTLARITTSEAVDKYYKTFNSHALEEYFSRYTDTFPILSYANGLGEEEVKTAFHGRSLELEDVAKTFNFRETELQPNTVVISEPHESVVLSQHVLALSYRYVDYFDEFLGYVKATLPVNFFNQSLGHLRLGDAGYVLIVDEHGNIVHAPETHYLSDKLVESDTSVELTGALFSEEVQLFKEYTLLGTKSMVAAATIPDINWSVFVALPMQELNKQLSALTNTLLIVATILVGVGMLIAQQFSKALTKPITLLTHITEDITRQGKLSERLTWTSQDELGRLATSFNQMLDQLQQSQSDLIESRQHIEEIVSSMADTVLVTTAEGAIIKANKAAVKMLAYSEEVLIGKHIDELIGQEEELFKALVGANIANRNVIDNLETTLLTKERKRIPVVFSGSTLRDGEGNLQGMVFVAKDITERKRAEEHLNYLANHDTLTGLPNRMLFLDRLTQAMSRLPWRERSLAVMFLDLDRFKLVNDTLGHDVGDQLLKGVSTRLTECVRDGDTVARLGGDEFVIMLNDIARKRDVIHMAEKIIKALGIPFSLGSQEFVATTSIGVSLYPTDGDDPHVLLKNADTAMYRAKESGRNNFQLYTPSMNSKAAEQMAVENAVRHGLERNEFIPYYQPQVSLATGRITAVEALVRWQHPKRGLIMPDEFLPLAEETGLIVPLGEQVLYQACRQGKAWHDAGLTGLTVAVNIANRQFKQANLPKVVSKVLTETGLPPENLELELTEGILIDHVDSATETLDRLKAMGVMLSIDDFGTGYSSLGHLKQLNLDKLKIDRSFIMDTPNDRDDVAITSAVIQMGESLGLDVVAEGVENKEQVEFLRTLGCKSIQGYYFSRPLPAEEMELMLREKKTLHGHLRAL